MEGERGGRWRVGRKEVVAHHSFSVNCCWGMARKEGRGMANS